jgi:RNA polymerase sigma factor (sigma-70 family)
VRALAGGLLKESRSPGRCHLARCRHLRLARRERPALVGLEARSPVGTRSCSRLSRAITLLGVWSTVPETSVAVGLAGMLPSLDRPRRRGCGDGGRRRFVSPSQRQGEEGSGVSVGAFACRCGGVTAPLAQRCPDDEIPSQTYALVERARAGDADAWEELYRRAYPGLLGYARRRLPSQQAEDAVSETMTRAVAGIGRFAWQGVAFDGWLYGIHRHVVTDAQRTHARSPRSGNGSEPPEVASNDPCPLETLVHTEELDAVRAAFGRLDPADRELLELRVVGGLSADEVSAVLGKRSGAVRMAQSRALTRLRRLLAEEDQ